MKRKEPRDLAVVRPSSNMRDQAVQVNICLIIFLKRILYVLFLCVDLASQHVLGVTSGVTMQTMQIQGVIQKVYFVAAGVILDRQI